MSTATSPAPVEAKGGWDGVIVSFGDGCTINTVNTLIGKAVEYTCEITLANGETIVCGDGHFSTDDDGNAVLVTHLYDDDAGQVTSDMATIDFDDIVAINVH